MNDVNIGLVIEQRINELGISRAEFARRMGIPKQLVKRILDKKSIDTDKLVDACNALKCNFFKLYENKYEAPAEPAEKQDSTSLSPEEEISYLKAIIQEKERTIQLLMERNAPQQ